MLLPLFDFCRDDWFDVDTTQREQSPHSKQRVQSPHSKQRVQSPHSHRKYNYSSVKEKHSPPGTKYGSVKQEAASTSIKMESSEDGSLPGPSRLAAEGEIHTQLNKSKEFYS